MPKYKERECPGCHKTVHMGKDEICSDCERRIKMSDEAIKLLNGMEGIGKYIFKRWFPISYYNARGSVNFPKELEIAGSNLIESFSLFMGDYWEIKGDVIDGFFGHIDKGNLNSVYITIPIGVREAALEFRKVIIKTLEEVYNAGIEDGKNLLSDLMNDKITLRQFDAPIKQKAT